MNDSLHGCEANSGARKFGGAMKALKRCKEFFGERHVKTCSVVPNAVDEDAVFRLGSEGDARVLATARELPCVAEAVLEDPANENRIAVSDQPLLIDAVHRPLRLAAAKPTDYRARQPTAIH